MVDQAFVGFLVNPSFEGISRHVSADGIELAMEKVAVLVSQSKNSGQALDIGFLTDGRGKWRILGIQNFPSEGKDEKDREVYKRTRYRGKQYLIS